MGKQWQSWWSLCLYQLLWYVNKPLKGALVKIDILKLFRYNWVCLYIATIIVMTDIENHWPETPQTTSSIISDKNLAYAQDVIGDFVSYAQIGNDGSFLSEHNYEGLNIKEEREKWSINEGLLSLLSNLESPDTAEALLNFLATLDKPTEIKSFLSDDKVQHYFNDLSKYDLIQSKKDFKNNIWEDFVWSSEDYKTYQKKLVWIKDKYQKLLVGVEGDKKDDSSPEEWKEKPVKEKKGKENSEKAAELTAELDKLTPDDLPNFKEALTALKEWKVSVELLDPLNTMTQVLKVMANMDQKQVITQVQKFIDTKKEDISEAAEKEVFEKSSKNFVDTLNIVLGEKETLNKFVETIDGELNGFSYDALLIEAAKAPANLDSPGAKMALNTILHRDEELFNQLLTDFDTPGKKTAVENILKEYYSLSNPSPLAEWVTFEKTQTKIGEKNNIDWFVIKESDNNYVMNGDEPVFIHFGESGTAEAMSLSKSIQENERVQSALKITDGKYNITSDTKKVIWELMQNKVAGSNVYANFGDALSALFNTWPLAELLDRLKIALIGWWAMGSENPEDQEKAELQIAYINMKSQWRKESFLDKKTNKNINCSYALSKYEPSSKEGNWVKSYKQLFVNASPEVQKSYIETAYKEGKEAWYKVLRDDSPLPDTKKETPKEEIAGGIDVKTDIPLKTVELLSWTGTVEDLKITSASSGKVELVSDADSPYLLVDGQVVSLLSLNDSLSVWSLFVETKPWEVQEKKVTLSTVDWKQTIAIENIWNPLDVSDSTNGEKKKEVFENNVMKYPKEGINSEQLPMRNYFAWSSHGPAKTFYDTITNITEDSVKKSIQKSLAIAQASIDASIGSTDHTSLEKDIQLAIKLAKKDMLDAWNNLDPSLVSAINDWATMFWVEEKTSI